MKNFVLLLPILVKYFDQVSRLKISFALRKHIPYEKFKKINFPFWPNIEDFEINLGDKKFFTTFDEFLTLDKLSDVLNCMKINTLKLTNIYSLSSETNTEKFVQFLKKYYFQNIKFEIDDPYNPKIMHILFPELSKIKHIEIVFKEIEATVQQDMFICSFYKRYVKALFVKGDVESIKFNFLPIESLDEYNKIFRFCVMNKISKYPNMYECSFWSDENLKDEKINLLWSRDKHSTFDFV